MSKNLKTGLFISAATLAFAFIFQRQLWAVPLVLIATWIAGSKLIAWSDEGSEENQGDERA
jgi:hypothetical protein